MAYGIVRNYATRHLLDRDAAFYQNWLHQSMEGWFGEPCLGRHAFKGVESVIFGDASKGMEATTVGESLSYIVDILTPREKAAFQKALIDEVSAIIKSPKTDRKVQLGSLFVLTETAYLTGMRDIMRLLPDLKAGFELTQNEDKQMNDLIRDASASLDAQRPQPSPGPAP